MKKEKVLNIVFSEVAAAQLGQTGKLTGGKQDYNQSTLGAWVLVNAVTGDQMADPLSGHAGGIVCTGDVLWSRRRPCKTSSFLWRNVCS